MKKLLVTVIGATAAIGAFAATPVTSLRFESANFVVGETNSVSQLNTNHEGTYWSETGTSVADNAYVIETAASVTSGGMPYETAPTKALNVKTKFGNPLSVNVVNGGETQTVGTAGIYFDSLVKFTVCDDAPSTQYDGAKIVMWLQETTNSAGVVVATNLYVNAGNLSYDNVNGVQSVSTVYQCGGNFNTFADSLHRVTIKAIANITTDEEVSVPGFAIFIDGSGENATRANCLTAKWDSTFTEQFSFAESVEKLVEFNALFPSLDQTTGNKLKLSTTSFDGTGSITDIAFYDESPAKFADDYVSDKATVSIGEHVEPFTSIGAAIEYVNGLSAGVNATFALSKGMTLSETLAFESAANVVFDFAGCVLTNTSDSAVAISNAGKSLTLTNSTGNVGGIYCAAGGAAVSQAGTGALVIGGGMFDGDVDFSEALDVTVIGGSFKNDDTAFETAERESGTWIADGKVLQANQTTGLNDVVDYVVPTYTVTFDSNGGSAVAAEQVTEGDTVAEPTAPTKTGYVFNGWTLLDSAYDFTTPVMSDIILVAQWRAPNWADYLGDAVDGAYEIDNLTELKAFQANIASSTNELKLATAGVTFKLTDDIALDEPWPGIGVQNGKDIYTTADFNAAAFQGTFDGQNHTISGFQMVGKGDKAEGLDYCGFFNSTYGATIQNLKIQYAGSLFAADTTASTKESGATFVGVAKNSTLRNLTTVAGTVSCSKGFGGIVGYLTSGTLVDSCTNNVNMTSLANNKCGGIAMIAQGGSAVTIQNCQNNGTQTTGSSNSEYGAIVGYVGLDITIANCETTVGRFLKHQGNTVTLQGVNKGDATVLAYHGAAATPGLNFATVDGNVATFVADNALAAGNIYKVMGPSATATFEFAEAGTIAFDTALATPTFVITAPGLTLTDSTDGTVTTYTAAASATPIEPGQSSQSYATEAAAEAAAASMEIGVPEAVATALSTDAQATYKAMFEKNVVSDGAGGYKVEVAMTAAAVAATQTQADADAAEVVEDLTEANVTLTTTPGLYYSFEYGTSLENMTEGARTLATSSSLELARPTTENATSGFYKVLVNLTDK